MAALLPLVLVAGAGTARADDECASDADCAALYADGFVCATGSLGRYCIDRGCLSDADCTDEFGREAWCESWGLEGRCAAPPPPKYVPPFHSMCSTAAPERAPGSILPLVLVMLGIGALGRPVRRRGRSPRSRGPRRPSPRT